MRKASIGAGQRHLPKESFGAWFKGACKAAGVPGSAHGLRKAGATRAANNGATVAQLEAIFGWTGGKMASLYTRTADRTRLAKESMAKLRGLRRPIPEEILEKARLGDCFVYFIRAGNRVKIGHSKDVRQRAAALQTAMPERLEIIYVMRGGEAVEAHLHERFASYRLCGEWFEYRGGIEGFLDSLKGTNVENLFPHPLSRVSKIKALRKVMAAR